MHGKHRHLVQSMTTLQVIVRVELVKAPEDALQDLDYGFDR